MTSEKKIKSLIGIVVFLLLSNIAMLIFFVLLNNDTRHASGNHENNLIGSFLKNDIGFSATQMTEYDTMRNEHLRNMKPLFDKMRSVRDSFYGLLYIDALPDSVINSKAAIIGERQAEMDKNFLRHLQEVRKLCKPEQLPKFDSSFKVVVSKITNRGRRGSEHRKEK